VSTGIGEEHPCGDNLLGVEEVDNCLGDVERALFDRGVTKTSSEDEVGGDETRRLPVKVIVLVAFDEMSKTGAITSRIRCSYSLTTEVQGRVFGNACSR
jgi:hypothetical protein